MTLLPSKNNLVGLNQTQGTVRAALGDFLDAVSEALGTSGTAPLIRNAVISGATSVGIGVGMTTPGTTLQVFGSFAVTDTITPAANPGTGSGFIRNQINFGNQNRVKLLFNSDTSQAIGTQPGVLYQRTPLGGGFSFFIGGNHNSNPYDAGGGTEVFRISNTQLQYRGQAVYNIFQHGILASLTTSQTWTAFQDFASRVRFRGENVTIGTSEALTPIVFDWNSANTLPGTRIFFGGFNHNLSMGVHTNILVSMYLRADGFAVYHRGTHTDSFGDPGIDGTVLFAVNMNTITYRNNRLLDTSMYGHTADNSGINADMVDGVHADSLLTKLSNSRPGVNVLYRWDADVTQGVRLEWFNNRMWLFSWDLVAGTAYETAVDYAHNARLLAGIESSEYVRRVSPTRNGINILYRWDLDAAQACRLEGSDGRLRLMSWEIPTGVPISTSVDYAYAAGTAQNISGSVMANQIHKGSNSVRVPVHPINGGSDTSLPRFDVNVYLLADMILSGNNTGRYVFVASVSNAATAPYRSYCAFVPGTSTPSGAITVSWEYLSNSGHPEMWVAYNPLSGEIAYMTESEDPINEDNSCPMHDLGEGLKYSLITIPDLETITRIQEKMLIKADSKKNKNFKACLDKLVLKRGFAMQPTDTLEELVYEQDPTKEKQQWRQLLILRAIQQSLTGDKVASCIDIVQSAFKVGNKGKLILK